MAWPDIKGAGALADVLRWGNPHHGLLDGNVLPDGAAGVSHPSLRAYEQRPYLFITPVIKHVVPGYVAPTLPTPVLGLDWRGYSILSGMFRAVYQTNIFAGASSHSQWLASFANKDTWRCVVNPSAIVAGTGGGSLLCTVTLTRFGNLQRPPVTAETIVLVSNTVSPAGQPVYATADAREDFTNTPLKVVTMDISEDGTRAILAVMPDVVDYFGYSAPRGLFLLVITKTTATLTMLKTRQQMLVQITRSNAPGQPPPSAPSFSCTSAPGTLTYPAYFNVGTDTTVATNLIGAFFDATGALEYLECSVTRLETLTTNRDAYTTTCTICSGGQYTSCLWNAQTATSRATWVVQLSAEIRRLVIPGVIATGSVQSNWYEQNQNVSDGVSGSWVINNSKTLSFNETSIVGRTYTSNPTVPSNPQTTASAPQSPGSQFPLVDHYPAYDVNIGTTVRAPLEFSAAQAYPVSVVGTGGLFAHWSKISGEAGIRQARSGGGGYSSPIFPNTSDRAVVSMNPHTGVLGKKNGVTVGGGTSFGWV